jgi:hypothetical protein
MSTQAMSEPKQKWYQQRWLLFVMSVPAASVILSSIMIYHAVTGKDSLVNDNYYKYGMEINQTIGQDKLAKSLAVEATVTIKEDGDVIINLESLATEVEPFLTLKLVHPTLGNLDSETKLFPSPSGYTAQVPENLSGLWYLDLYSHDESWRIRRQTSLPTNAFVMTP